MEIGITISSILRLGTEFNNAGNDFPFCGKLIKLHRFNMLKLAEVIIMDQHTFARRLSFIKGIGCILEPMMDDIDNGELNLAISKASPAHGEIAFYRIEQLALSLADKYQERKTVSAILELSRK